MGLMGIPVFSTQQKQALIRKNYNEIYAHEAAHKRAAGSLAGPIVIEKNADGIYVKEYESLPFGTYTVTETNADVEGYTLDTEVSVTSGTVAHQAKVIKAEAENEKRKKGLDYYA